MSFFGNIKRHLGWSNTFFFGNVKDYVGWVTQPESNPLFDAEAEAWFLRLAATGNPLPDAEKPKWTSLFYWVKRFNGASSITQVIDYSYFFGDVNAEANARINLASASFPIVTAQGVPTWVNTGYTGGPGKALKNGYVDTVNASAFRLSDGFMAIYVNTEGGGVLGGLEIEIGNWVDDNTAINTSLAARYSGTGGAATGNINVVNTSTENASLVGSAIGFTAIEKDGTQLRLWKNGVLIKNVPVSSTGLSAFENHILAILYGGYGVIIRHSTKEVYSPWKGRSTYCDQADLNFRMDNVRSQTVIGPAVSLGRIYRDTFARLTIGSNWTATSGVSCDGIQLVGVNGASNWTVKATYTGGAAYISNLERFVRETHINVGALDGEGVAIAFDGLNNSLKIKLFLTGADAGKIKFFSNNGVTALATSATAMTLNASDNLVHTFVYHKGRALSTFQNMTTPGTLSLEYMYSLISPIVHLKPCVFAPAIYFTGGTQYVTLDEFTSPAEKNGRYCFIGDSITSGYFAGFTGYRFAEQVGIGQLYNIIAGPGNKAADFNIDEIVALKAQTYLACIGTNAVYAGDNLALEITRIGLIVSAVEAAGKEFILCKIPPLNTVDVTTFNNMLVTAFGARVQVDLFTLLKDGGTGFNPLYSNDGIHPDAVAQPIIATYIAGII